MILTCANPIAREFSFHAEAFIEVPFSAQVVTEDTVAITIANANIAYLIAHMDDCHTALETRIHIQILHELEMESATKRHRQFPIRMSMFYTRLVLTFCPITISKICA